MECKKGLNVRKCSCTYQPCPRKGVCCDCLEYHRKNGELPGCLFSREGEATYDRSVANFVRDQRNNGQ